MLLLFLKQKKCRTEKTANGSIRKSMRGLESWIRESEKQGEKIILQKLTGKKIPVGGEVTPTPLLKKLVAK